jgi:hypothetical protein
MKFKAYLIISALISGLIYPSLVIGLGMVPIPENSWVGWENWDLWILPVRQWFIVLPVGCP